MRFSLPRNPQIRKRLLFVILLLSLIGFLVYFDIQQGFSDWKQINSNLSIFVALNVNILLLVILFYLTLRNLLKIIYERKQRVLGARLKTKLMVTFLLLSLPATLFHLFASSLISSTLESWLAGQHEAVLQNAQQVVSAYHQNLKNLMQTQGWVVESLVQEHVEGMDQIEKVKPALASQNIEGITFYGEDQSVLYQELRSYKANKYWKPLSDAEWEQALTEPQAWLVEDIGNRLLYRFLIHITLQNATFFIEIFYPATKKVTSALGDISEQEVNTQIFTESEDLIKKYYVLLFLVMTLAIVFVAMWLAMYLARGFVQPIERLADATLRVSSGDLGYQIVDVGTVSLDRDFGLLINSFNRMSEQLLENQLTLETTANNLQKSHETLEEHTRFVELVLENIQTGVMALDMEGRITSLNRSAKKLLQLKTEDFLDQPYREVLDEESLTLFEEMVDQMEMLEKRIISQNITLKKHDPPLHIAVTLLVLENREKERMGMISVYENITEIQRFQRARAWRDVARRIAHEIKNPLTPIQLSAQQIRRKYLGDVEEPEVLDQATLTIVEEVESLKNMVKEFSNFARLRESNPQSNNLNAIVEEAAMLYRNALPQGVQLQTQLDDALPDFPLDQEQIKRVFINLIDNALAAVDNEGLIQINTHYNAELRIARAEVIDNGSGVPPEILGRLFEPYATTKIHGTGLGLTITAQIISDHNGIIRHRHEDSGGSCFYLELPVHL